MNREGDIKGHITGEPSWAPFPFSSFSPSDPAERAVALEARFIWRA